MSISGPSALNPIWTSRVSPAAATRAGSVEDGEHINIFAKLTPADRELIYQSTGWRMPDGFGEGGNEGGNQEAVMIPKMAAILAMDRQAGRLGLGQEVTAAYIRDAVQQYQRTSLDGSNPYRGEEWDKALAYLASKGGRTDVNA